MLSLLVFHWLPYFLIKLNDCNVMAFGYKPGGLTVSIKLSRGSRSAWAHQRGAYWPWTFRGPWAHMPWGVWQRAGRAANGSESTRGGWQESLCLGMPYTVVQFVHCTRCQRMGQLRAKILLELLVPSFVLCCRFFCSEETPFSNLSIQSGCLFLTCV